MELRLPDWLATANQEFERSHPGESGARQPVHVVYGGAHLFKADTCRKLGRIAERALADYAPDAATLAHATVATEDRASPERCSPNDFRDRTGLEISLLANSERCRESTRWCP